MAILKNVWRFQCDPNGDADPTVQVFLKKTTTVDGQEFVINDMTAVPMKFSELTGGLSDLVNATKISAKADSIKAELAEGK
jgi:hypothetical protein